MADTQQKTGPAVAPGGNSKAAGSARERRAFARYPFVAESEIVDLRSRIQISARTSEISLGGCYVETMNPLLAGTAIYIRLLTAKGTFETNARIAYVQPGIGMGVAFLDTPPEQRRVLESWIEPVRRFLQDEKS
ncbi:MAG TPA: PilZ domain-containing protein [Methylomirabilota bacterium]|nr:PilZ domain-containing protein [Methylomirabilota bacterium]